MEELLGDLFSYDPDNEDPTEAGVLDARRGHGWRDIHPTNWAVLLGPGRATVMDAETYAEIYEEPVKLYGMWQLDEDLAKTGWMTTSGRVIVAEDPEELTKLAGIEAREYPGVISHAEWLSQEVPPRAVGATAIQTGPEHYREGVRLLAAAADRATEGRAYGEAHPADFLIGQLATRAKAHFAAAQVAATAAAVHPDSVSWREAIGL